MLHNKDAPGCSKLEHGSQLTQINHKCGLRHTDGFLGGNAGEDAVCEANGGFCCRHKGANMSQKDNQSYLLAVAAFA